MQSFLSNVINNLLNSNESISNYTFILPSKRAGIFLKNELKSKINKTIIFPEILSIENFVQEISSLFLIDNTSLLFEFYSIYLKNTKKELAQNFDDFSKWATIALQDFNEIDRHLIDSKYIFSYLKDINQLEKWSVEKGSESKIIKNYFTFFEQLEKYHTELSKHLLENKYGYQGLLYREAVENLHNYIESNSTAKLVFIGFNALNRSEEIIIQELLEHNLASIYWDIDAYYFNNHPASFFIRKYKNSWKYYQNNNPFNWIQENLNQKKNINIIGVPKNNTQLKYIGEILSKLGTKDCTYENTALVLSDESLLPVALNSFPKKVSQVNITMGYDLINMSISSLFSSLFKLHSSPKNSNKSFYYKNVIEILNHPSIKRIINTHLIVDEILKNNYIYLKLADINRINKASSTESKLYSLLFENWNNNAYKALNTSIELVELLKEKITDKLEREFLYKILTVLKQIELLNSKYSFIKTIKTLHQVYLQIVKIEKLSFEGEPLSGLQLMGMLETRVLDFETVILSSVNEGILPAGKSDNSFIPFDVKKEVGLPTYQEKDAIFSYHFYRLIQRAKNVYLLYNTESDSYGSGEKSRFITELEISKSEDIQNYIISPKVNSRKKELKQIKKTLLINKKLQDLAQKGFSPTTLVNYINNPIDFYQQKILGVKEITEIEETVATNTLGTIIHKTLESFYIPFKGKILKKEDVLSMKNDTPLEVKKWFKKEYINGDITSGKNLLIYNVAQQFILNFLDKELQLLNNGKQLKVLELEYNLETEIEIKGIGFPIKLAGQVDRIDELDGILRIIDYKTGKVEQKDLTVKDWSLITTDYKKYSKSFQVLFYAYVYSKMNNLDFDTQLVESGIISFKNLKSGFLKINKKAVTNDDITNFINELKQLILEIFNTEIPFIENENKSF